MQILGVSACAHWRFRVKCTVKVYIEITKVGFYDGMTILQILMMVVWFFSMQIVKQKKQDKNKILIFFLLVFANESLGTC